MTNPDSKAEALAVRAVDAARMLSISPRTLWGMTRRNEIPHARCGRAVVYPVHLLREWLEQRAKGGNGDGT
jgi:hypothetical protein